MAIRTMKKEIISEDDEIFDKVNLDQKQLSSQSMKEPRDQKDSFLKI